MSKMDQGKICGIAFGLFGGWLLFGAWQSILTGIRDEAPWEIIFHLAFNLQFVASMAAFIVGVSALTELKGEAWFAGFATIMMGILVITMIVSDAEKSEWQYQIVYLFILTALFLGILVTRGHQMGGGDSVAREVAAIAKEDAKTATKTSK